MPPNWTDQPTIMQKKLVYEPIVSHGFGQNAYVAHLESSSECIVVDPGFDAPAIQQYLTDNRLTPKAILNTHGHIDHIAGNEFLKRSWTECPIVNDANKLTDPSANLSLQFGASLTSPPADQLVSDGEVYEVAGITLEVVAVPGHSQGHVVFVWKGESPWVVFGGDILFHRGIGRSDFPDSDTQTLWTSIRTKLFTMPEDTIVLPGHGDSTTIGDERRFNPFVGDGASPLM